MIGPPQLLGHPQSYHIRNKRPGMPEMSGHEETENGRKAKKSAFRAQKALDGLCPF
jgi:hypothetical protein